MLTCTLVRFNLCDLHWNFNLFFYYKTDEFINKNLFFQFNLQWKELSFRTMKFLLAFYILISFQLSFIHSLVYSIDEKFQSCNNGSKNYFDLSTLNFTMVGDTETNVDGKLKFIHKVNSKWRTGFFGERYDRGQWSLMFQRKVDDFCNHILNPMEM